MISTDFICTDASTNSPAWQQRYCGIVSGIEVNHMCTEQERENAQQQERVMATQDAQYANAMDKCDH